MKGELYLRVKLGLPGSDEARILGRHLGEKRAWSYTLEMWDWFARTHPSGELTGKEAAYLIAQGAGWDGDADKFCSAQVLAGFLAVIPEGFRVRGWEKWAGFYFTVKAKEQSKKARQRKPVPAVSPSESPGCPRDVPGTEHENAASGGACPGDPSHISSIKSSVGVQGEGKRGRLVSPFGASDPTPATTAVLAALFDRGIDAAPPSARQAERVEAAIKAATVEAAVERLAPILADPSAKRPLTYHVDAIRGPSRPARGVDDSAIPWNQRLSPDEHAEAQAELAALALQDPELEGAPLGIVGNPSSPAYAALQAVNAKWRAVAAARAEGVT